MDLYLEWGSWNDAAGEFDGDSVRTGVARSEGYLGDTVGGGTDGGFDGMGGGGLDFHFQFAMTGGGRIHGESIFLP